MARRRVYDHDELVGLRTTAGRDGHRHVARFDANGRGRTSTDAGHFHWIDDLDVRPGPDGHTHELTEARAAIEPDRPTPTAPAAARRKAAA